MGKQKNIENYEIKRMMLSELLPADYNPRKIEPAAEKELKKFIQEYGLLYPSFVFNKLTGHLVGGHQRLVILFSAYGDIEVNVSVVELSEKDEVKANIKLNNANLMGSFDNEKLYNVVQKYQLTVTDTGFTLPEMELRFAEFKPVIQEEKIVYNEYQEAKKAEFKQAKDDYRKKMQEKNKNGNTIYTKEDDYNLTIVFENNQEKWDFMKAIGQEKEEKFIKGKIIQELIDGV